MRRDTWIDGVKIFACILVAVGHFIQSMVTASIYPQNAFFDLFNQSIYSFHVPLFFICSGYLYQKGTAITSCGRWFRHIAKKLLILGVPYFIFSIITWLTKYLFTGDVNTQVAGLFESLFIHPLSPYWYLFALFLFFLAIPPCKKKSLLPVYLLIALSLKVISCFIPISTYLLSVFCSYCIWFVFGMTLKHFNVYQYFEHRTALFAGSISLVVFLSYTLFHRTVWHETESFLLGFVACFAFISLAGYTLRTKTIPWITRLSQYTLPVFLMHTLFAAPVRIILLKFSVTSIPVHTIMGLIASFAGPVIATIILNTNKYTAWILKPQRLLPNPRR